MQNFHTLTNAKRRSLFFLAAIAFMSFLLQVTAPSAWAQFESNEHYRDADDPIEGSWIFKIDKVGQGVSFTALTSFAAGGVTVATGSLDKVNPISPVYGSWKRTGFNRIAVTIYFFLFDPAGNAVGLLKTDESFSLEGRNALLGAGSSFVCDVEGNNCSNHGTEALITITGKRIKPMGLPNL
jgi:hypothetical protein